MIGREVRHRQNMDVIGLDPNNDNVKNVRLLTGVGEMGRIFRADNLSVRIGDDEPAETVAINIGSPTVPGWVFDVKIIKYNG